MTKRDRFDCIIVGAGIAGIAAAERLSALGQRVLLVESRKKLGGRASSFTDVRSGDILDNCQHLALGCCTNFTTLLARLGTADKLAWHQSQYWREPGGRESVISCRGLLGRFPAPSHYGAGLLMAHFLTLSEKAALIVAVAEIMGTDRVAWRGETFAAFLSYCQQPARLIQRFWEPVVASACNLDCSKVAASSALHVFQEGFFSTRDAASLGIPTCPLSDLFASLGTLLAQRGSELRLGVLVQSVSPTSITIARTGEQICADRVICAVPHEHATGLVAAESQHEDARFAAMRTFGSSPIVGVHLQFDRPVLRTPHVVLVDRPTQWLFATDHHLSPSGITTRGARLCAVISAADGWMELDEAAMVGRVAEDLRECVPESAGATLLWGRAIKERRATIAPTPAMEACRPGATVPGADLSRADGMILAGDYTNTGWPSTMEGATRSGLIAAAAVVGYESDALLTPSLRVAPLAALLGVRHPVGTGAPGYN